MTSDQLNELRSMTKASILRKYWPLVSSGKISSKDFKWLIEQGKNEPVDETATMVAKHIQGHIV